MPRTAEWLGAIPDALEALAKFSAPVIDRPTLARLLGLHRRAAIRLMHRLAGYQSGRVFLIETRALVSALEAIAAGEPYRFESGRRERLGQALATAARETKARRIKIPIDEERGREVSGLPGSIRLAPGRLEISCSDATDLLRQLMQLAEAVRDDYEAFEARLRGDVR